MGASRRRFQSGQLTLDRGVGTPTESLEVLALCPARGLSGAVGVWVFAGIDSHKDTLAVAVIDRRADGHRPTDRQRT